MKFFSADVPCDKTIIQHIKDNSPFVEAQNDVKAACRAYHEGFTAIAIDPMGLKKLRFGVFSAIGKYGVHGWLNTEGRDIGSYRSFSMTYNPHHTEHVAADPHLSTLGSRAVAQANGFYGGDLSKKMNLRNGYYDTFAFNQRTPATREFGIDEFTTAFNSTLVRSRTSAIQPNNPDATQFHYGWHRDESMFENMRIVIPIQTNDCYLMQLGFGDELPVEGERLLTAQAPYGSAILFDSNLPHRAYRAGETDLLRVHTIFGVSPWIDYLPEEDAWVFNEHFGKTHPIDMLKRGHINPLIGDHHA